MIVLHKDKDITDYVSSMSWGGSKSQMARKLELRIVNAPLDPNVQKLEIALADPIYLFEDDGKTELFRGFITEREASSLTGTVSYVAYDILFYTLKSTATYNFSGKTAEAITQMVCGDLEIPVGSVASTGISQKLIVQNKTIYDIISEAYAQATEQSKKEYIILARKGKLCVERVGGIVCEIELAEDSNIISSKYKESITNMVNRVKIYDGEGNPVGMVQNDKDLKYGVFQQVYTKEEGKDATTTAKSMFKGVEKTFTLECVNFNGAITGAGAIVRDSSTGLSGDVWIEADTHTYSNGVATMSLTVTLRDRAAEVVEEEKKEEKKEYKVGDLVQFNGGTHYISSTATKSGGSPSAGPAKITIINKGSAHPYHLVTEDWGKTHVWGWVDEGSFS
ncbi:hypothetical protein CE91St46_14790 [Eubacteriales bacterium]|nr:hypothetical protein CE91St46_14790 [Eubacteriales bacterium]GKH63091.1 hypothetical protein CE91St47_15600 [Eubacteriales bacterium]